MKKKNIQLFVTIWLFIPLFFYQYGAAAQPAENVSSSVSFESMQFLSQSVPESVAPGQNMHIEIKIKNVGTTTWAEQEDYALTFVSAAPGINWSTERIELNSNELVQPGDIKTFTFDLTAPKIAGVYPFEWQMVHKDRPLSGDKIPPLSIVVENALNRAQFVSQLIPTTMSPGEQSKAIIQFKNTGKTAWSSQNRYKLAFIGKDKEKWAKSTVENTNVILPGEIATFSFVVSAPISPGQYDFQWQMIQEGQGLFGDITPPTKITIERANPVLTAHFSSIDVPAIMNAGQDYEAIMIFKNTGTASWTADNIALLAHNPENSLIWLIDRVELSPQEVVRPGQSKRFIFTVRAPQDSGIYLFEWQLHSTTQGFFGEKPPAMSIIVKAAN